MEFYHKLNNKEDRLFSYFSMEIGLNEFMQTYSGGLGILAGDTVKSFADRHVPMIAISLLNEKGYFKQELNEFGDQIEKDNTWKKEDYLMKLDEEIEVQIDGRNVKVTAWEYRVIGNTGYEIPIYFLDTDIEGNSDYDRTLTKHLYGGDEYYRLCQEVVLGIGGVRFIKKRGYNNLLKYHMNEGHAAFLTLELLRENNYDRDAVKKMCIFTTHTAVAAGHDNYDVNLAKRVVGDDIPDYFIFDNKLSMTHIGLNLSHYINGVAKKHGEVSRELFPGYTIDYITNGVHSTTWTSKYFQDLFDEKLPCWRIDPYTLRYAVQLNLLDVWNTHQKAKKDLIKLINERKNENFEEEVFTIGFARRATSYKRMDLLFHDINRLKIIAKNAGKLQLVFAGKAHVRDYEGKMLIKKVFSLKEMLGENIKLVFLENYNMELAKVLIPGVDIWLNTPKRPLEASGTSGMKACHNGVPSFSILDGWWIEGHIENYTGWSIGNLNDEEHDEVDANDMYFKLEKIILPMYYNRRDDFIKIMKNSIAFNASFFNTNRMVSQYVLNAYLN